MDKTTIERVSEAIAKHAKSDHSYGGLFGHLAFNYQADLIDLPRDHNQRVELLRLYFTVACTLQNLKTKEIFEVGSSKPGRWLGDSVMHSAYGPNTMIDKCIQLIQECREDEII